MSERVLLDLLYCLHQTLNFIYMRFFLLPITVLFSSILFAQTIFNGHTQSILLCNDSSVSFAGLYLSAANGLQKEGMAIDLNFSVKSALSSSYANYFITPDNKLMVEGHPQGVADNSFNNSNKPWQHRIVPYVKHLYAANVERNIFATDTNGNVYSWGQDTSLLGYPKRELFKAKKIVELSNIKKVESGLDHAVALSESGHLFIWGANDKGQLGNISASYLMSPLLFEDLKNIRDVSVGNSHTLAIDKNGSLWFWGDNSYGQCGKDPNVVSTIKQPAKLESNIKYIKAIARGDLSVLIDENNKIFFFGKNDFNTFLQDSNVLASYFEPTMASWEIPIKDIAVSNNHSFIALDTLDRAWAWGYNSTWHLGIGGNVNWYTKPVYVKHACESINSVFENLRTIDIHPKVSQGLVYHNLTEKELLQLRVFNSVGQIQKLSIEPSYLDLSNLKPGVYFVSIPGYKTERLVKY